MNLGLWILQGLAAFAFLAAGGMKLAMPRQKLVEKGQGWAGDFSDGKVKLIGLAELLGGVGLLVPWASGVVPLLTPVAAACLAALMIGAAATHVRRGETPIPPIVLALICAGVAAGRFGLI